MQQTAKRISPLVGALLLASSCGDDREPGLARFGGGTGGVSQGQGGSTGAAAGPGLSGAGGLGGGGMQPDAGGCAAGELRVYRDLDGDGRHGAEQVICFGQAPPDGFDETTVGPDAADDDARSWTQGSLQNCRDEDGDGYFVDCDQPPLAAADCNDDAGFIRPGAIESLGVDFDCDPSTTIAVDDAHGVFIAPGGSDAEPCGTAADPCGTFARAEALLLAEPANGERRFIFAATGSYVEPTQLVLRHSAIGGFTAAGAVWTRPVFSARPETAAALSVISSATTGQARVEVTGDGLVLDGIGVDGPEYTGNCTALRVSGPTPGGGAPPLADSRGVLIVNAHVRHDCGPDSSNLTALQALHRLFLARTTLQIADDVTPPPASVHVLDLAPSFDPWLEELELSLTQAADNRYGLRVVPDADGITVHLRRSRIHVAGAAYGSASYGAHISAASLAADRLVLTDDNDTATGALHWGLLLTGDGQNALRADVLRSRIDVEQTALGLEQAQANVVQSFLDSKGAAAVNVASGSRLTVVHGLVRALGVSPVAISIAAGAGEVAVANTIFDVQVPDRAVAGINNVDAPLRLLHNVFFLDGDAPANECPVDVAGAACGSGFVLNDCSTWSSCSQSTGNLAAALSYQAGGSSGGAFEAWHLPASSPCIDLGQAPHALLPPGVPWLRSDVDGDPRPSGAGWDVGLDERAPDEE